MMTIKYSQDVGVKFHQDGSIRYFPGNTVIYDCKGIDPLFAELVWAQEEFKQLSFAHKFAFLPEDSFHMTVFDLVCDQIRELEKWSDKYPFNASVQQMDKWLCADVNRVAVPESVGMRFEEVILNHCITIRLLPADDQQSKALWDYREALSKQTGIRPATFQHYRFHITLAYNLILLDADELIAFNQVNKQVNSRLSNSMSQFELEKPYFSVFDDMGTFIRGTKREQKQDR